MEKGRAVVVLCAASLTACALGVDWDQFADAPATVTSTPDASGDVFAPTPIVATAAEAGPLPYASAVLASRPIAYYRFEEDDGSPVASDVAGAPTGTIEDDGKHVPGRVGRGIQLDGAGQDRIVFGFVLDSSRAFSFEVLVLVQRLNTDYSRIISLENGPGYGAGLAVYSTQSLLGFARADASGTQTMRTERAPIPTSAFVHLVAACNPAQCRLVVDGVTMKGSVPAGAAVSGVSAPFTVGARSVNANNVKGIFDELAIYDHALSDDEIAAHIAALP